MSKSKFMAGASALVAASLAFAGAAHATAPAVTEVFGGGSTLIGPYLVQAQNCYGVPAVLQNQGSYPYGAFSTTVTTPTAFVYTGTGSGTGNQNCGTTHVDTTVQFNYLGSGSGNGELGVFTHDLTTDVGVTGDVGGNAFTSIQYGAGDYAIGASEVAAYNNGGTLSQTTGATPAGTVTLLAPGVGGASGLTYANPVAQYGKFVQFPISIDPVAIAYSSTYKVVVDGSGNATYYHFNIASPNGDGSGGLKLDMPTLCAIFNGAIKNWNDPELQVLNGGTSLQDPTDPATNWSTTGLPIELVGRSDSSGTTSIFYRALASQCTGKYVEPGVGGVNVSKTYTKNYAVTGGKKLPAALQSGQVYVKTAPNNGPGSGVTPVAGKFTLATGTSSVAKYLAFTYTPSAGNSWSQGRIAYIGTDYALPYVANTGANTYGLNIADIKGTYNTTFLEPSAANAQQAFYYAGALVVSPPQTLAAAKGTLPAGAYAPTTTGYGLRSAPSDWAQPITTTFTYSNGTAAKNLLGNPKGPAAYPLVGTTNLFLNTCYASTQPQLVAFLNWYLTSPVVNDATNGLLAKSGLAPLPAVWTKAIIDTFLTPTKTVTPAPTAKTPIQKTTFYGTDALQLNLLPAAGSATTTVLIQNPLTGTPTSDFQTPVGQQCNGITPGA